MFGLRNHRGLLLFTALILAPANMSARAEQVLGIIDTHVHLVPGKDLDFHKAIKAVIEKMDQYGVATSILMPPPRSVKIRQNYDYSDFCEQLNEYPGRFLCMGGGGSLNITLHTNRDPEQVSEETKKEFAASARKIAAGGVVGYGEISSLHISLADKHAYSFVPADHPLLKVLADVAAEQSLPIDLHMDALARATPPPARLASLPNNPKKFPETLSALDRLLSHNAETTIVWAHAGTDHLGDFSPKVIRSLMEKHDNLYVSLKVVGPKAGTPNRLFSPGKIQPEWLSLLQRYSDRFVIGTDGFYTDPEGRGPGRIFAQTSENRLKATRAFLSLLPKGLSAKIAHQNAKQIYGLKSAQAPVISIGNSASTPSRPRQSQNAGLCKDGNMEHCKIVCQRGNQRACQRLQKGR
jgi:predicted TIM-barrel fold metal-dependent hydrolase